MKKRIISLALCAVLLLSLVPMANAANSLLVSTLSYDNAVYDGGVYDIEVEAFGTDLTYQWQGYGTKWLNLEDNDVYSGTHTSHLRYYPASPVDDYSGWSTVAFRCKVKGKEGTGYSPKYYMYIYSTEKLMERLEYDPVLITEVKHNAITPTTADTDKSFTSLYAICGETVDFSMTTSSLKSWMLETEITMERGFRVLDSTGYHVIQDDHVSVTLPATGDKGDILVQAYLELYIGGKKLDYSKIETYKLSSQQPQSIGTATVTVEDLPVYTTADSESILGTLKKGETVQLVKLAGNRYCILYGKGIGYVASAALYTSTEETRGKVSEISLAGIRTPVVGEPCDTDFETNGAVTVEEVMWWRDTDGDGASNESNCTQFQSGGNYYLRVRLAPAEGYYFPAEALSTPRLSYRYAGTVTINGESVLENIYCDEDGTYLYLDWWRAPAAPARQQEIEVTYDVDSAAVVQNERMTITASCNVDPAATDLTYQWYQAPDATHWGMPIEGANESTYTVPTDALGTTYYRCHITAMLNGQKISTPVENFKAIEITVEAPHIPSMYFDDVNLGNWFYGDVEYVYYNQLMNGVGNNCFEPEESCTRAMIVTVLYRMAGQPAVSGSNPFTDVRNNFWYTNAIIWAEENGIVKGVGKGCFEPDENVTREQLATIMYRYSDAMGYYDSEDSVMLAGFADCDKVASWAVDAMSWAVGVGLVGGSKEPDGLYLLPQGNALRCQVAAILHRFCEKFVD